MSENYLIPNKRLPLQGQCADSCHSCVLFFDGSCWHLTMILWIPKALNWVLWAKEEMAPKPRWRRNEWLHRGSIWSLCWSERECGDAATLMIPISLLLGWCNPGERIMGAICEERKKNFHQSTGEASILWIQLELVVDCRRNAGTPPHNEFLSHYCLGDGSTSEGLTMCAMYERGKKCIKAQVTKKLVATMSRIQLKLVMFDLTQNVEMPDQQIRALFHYFWVMKSWWESTAYYEPRKKWHRKDRLEIMCKDIICASTRGPTSHSCWPGGDILVRE